MHDRVFLPSRLVKNGIVLDYFYHSQSIIFMVLMFSFALKILLHVVYCFLLKFTYYSLSEVDKTQYAGTLL